MAAQIPTDTNSQVMEKFQQPTIYAVVGVRPAQSGPRSQYLIQQQHSIYTGQGTAELSSAPGVIIAGGAGAGAGRHAWEVDY